MIVAGAVAYEVVTAVVIPHFAPTKQFSYWQYTELGPNLPSALRDIVTHPWHAVRVFFTPHVKAETLAYLFVPLLLLPLRSRYAWLALPLLAENYFNYRPELWTTHYHYSALPWLVLVLAMVDGAQRLGVFAPAVVVAGAAELAGDRPGLAGRVRAHRAVRHPPDGHRSGLAHDIAHGRAARRHRPHSRPTPAWRSTTTSRRA